jgi:hypothetical protein
MVVKGSSTGFSQAGRKKNRFYEHFPLAETSDGIPSLITVLRPASLSACLCRDTCRLSGRNTVRGYFNPDHQTGDEYHSWQIIQELFVREYDRYLARYAVG